MTAENAHLTLDALIKQDKSFAIYRLPGETVPRFVMQTTGAPLLFEDIEKLNGQKGFVIAPFCVDDKKPILLIQPDCTDLSEVVIDDNILFEAAQDEESQSTDNQVNKETYQMHFDRFHTQLMNGEFEKLVLSRSKTIDRNASFSPGRSFFHAAKKYIYSYVYLFHTPQTGTWLGSTPEILLSGTGNDWKTIALAGTIFPDSNRNSWDDKNYREQELVSSYLSDQLAVFDISPEQNGPYTVKAGELAHLRTDFKFNLPPDPAIGSLLKALHPTPAVSGLPKDKAYGFIRENEEYDRLYYSGFLGMLDPGKQTDIYVNLRCMHIEKSSLTLFAGGGLLASSSIEEEWEETEHKMKTMLGILK